MNFADDLSGTVALVTGGGRGIGRSIALELTAAGARVAVSARTPEEVERTARDAGGLGIAGDVSSADDVARVVEQTERELGPIDLLVNNAGVGGSPEPFWEHRPDAWWRVFEINLLGPFLLCHAVVPRMLERGRGRIVNVGSGSAYLPGARDTAYGPSKAALCRFGENLANRLSETPVRVFTISPGLVRTAMTGHFAESAPWTPPELAPRLVRVLASGRADALAGRYIHAEHDDVEDLIRRAEDIREGDLNAIRLRR